MSKRFLPAGATWFSDSALRPGNVRTARISATTPMGTLMVKMAFQAKLVLKKPPIVGPKAGAIIIGMPSSAVAIPRSVGGKKRKMIANAIGKSEPPPDHLKTGQAINTSLGGANAHNGHS